MTKPTEEPINESKQFQFEHKGHSYNAYARHYDNGDVDVEVIGDDVIAEAYDEAWDVAESLGII
jgi:hypothetical protein